MNTDLAIKMMQELLNLREIAPEQYKAAFDLIDKVDSNWVELKLTAL